MEFEYLDKGRRDTELEICSKNSNLGMGETYGECRAWSQWGCGRLIQAGLLMTSIQQHHAISLCHKLSNKNLYYKCLWVWCFPRRRALLKSSSLGHLLAHARGRVWFVPSAHICVFILTLGIVLLTFLEFVL